MFAMPEDPGTQPAIGRRRGMLAFYVIAVVVVLLGAGLTLAWPGICLRYHQRRLRGGNLPQRIAAFQWISDNRLKRGMSRAEVERLLGQPLDGFEVISEKDVKHYVYVFEGAQVRLYVTFKDGRYQGCRLWAPAKSR